MTKCWDFLNFYRHCLETSNVKSMDLIVNKICCLMLKCLGKEERFHTLKWDQIYRCMIFFFFWRDYNSLKYRSFFIEINCGVKPTPRKQFVSARTVTVTMVQFFSRKPKHYISLFSAIYMQILDEILFTLKYVRLILLITVFYVNRLLLVRMVLIGRESKCKFLFFLGEKIVRWDACLTKKINKKFV